MANFKDNALKLTKKLTKQFNEASTAQKVGIGAVAAVTALISHPLVVGGLVTGGVAGAISTAFVGSRNKGNDGPKQ